MIPCSHMCQRPVIFYAHTEPERYDSWMRIVPIAMRQTSGLHKTSKTKSEKITRRDKTHFVCRGCDRCKSKKLPAPCVTHREAVACFTTGGLSPEALAAFLLPITCARTKGHVKYADAARKAAAPSPPRIRSLAFLFLFLEGAFSAGMFRKYALMSNELRDVRVLMERH